jgi:glycosyltransferase involved in cell wall biosynthesis
VDRRDGDGESHLVLIPSYNTGAKLLETVDEARRYWQTVWVVIDGSTDGSGEALLEQNREHDDVRILRRAANGGKGAAVLDGLHAAAADGFTHALVMDADGQHPAAMIPDFMLLSKNNRDAMILGVPVFDRHAPRARVIGRRVSNGLAKLETAGAIGDSLFGFRVYPIAPLRAVMSGSRWMRRFDFDVEAAVRLSWRGVAVINMPAPVRYFRPEEGGISHFRYGRDNLLLAGMHARLIMTCLLGMPGQARIRSSHH